MRTKRTKRDEDNLIVPEDPHTLCKWACIRDVQPSKNGPSSFGIQGKGIKIKS